MGGSRGVGEAGGSDPRKITSDMDLYREKTIGPLPPLEKVGPSRKMVHPTRTLENDSCL